ncbi:MAG: hypothetical protein DSZ28_06280 [Thiothrix sp.]|nr:MAG: hypothetical protein DSZ28_06280 [Thiothrix sp.]
MAVAGILAPALSYALGLGEISTNSALNQPLDADIQLISAAGEVDKVTVKLAPNAVFNQAGITRSGLLDQLEFEPISVDGAEVIKITSKAPIQEPFINFIIEVSWPKGKLLREYTVLLDPPVLGGAVSSAQQSTASAGESQPVDTGKELSPFVAGVQTEAADEPETFSVADEAGGAAPEDASGDSAGSPESGGVESTAAAESQIEDAESFSVTDEASNEGAKSYSGGVSEIFVSMAGASEGAAADMEVVKSETFSVTPPNEPVEGDHAEAADTNPETFSVTDSEASEEGSLFDPSEGVSDIFIAMPDVKSTTDLPGSTLEDPASSVVSAKPSIAAGDEEYQVNSGDTLSVLARKSVPNKGVSVAQMMAAFLRENPDAFANSNINSLKAGYILRVPDETIATQVSNEEAIRELDGHGGEVFAQYRSKMADAAISQQSMSGEAGSGSSSLAGSSSEQTGEVAGEEAVAQGEDKSELEILVPDAEAGPAAGNQVADSDAIQALEKEIALAKEQLESTGRETAELQSRVSDLEGIVSAKERLIQLKEEELTGLQQQLSEGATAQESRVAELEGVLAEKDSLIQSKETELSDLQQKLSEGTASQESKSAEIEGLLAEKDRLIQVKDAELAELQQRLTAAGSATEQAADVGAGQAADQAVAIESKVPPVGALEAEAIAELQSGGQADQPATVSEADQPTTVSEADQPTTVSEADQPTTGSEEAKSSSEAGAGVAEDVVASQGSVIESSADIAGTEEAPEGSTSNPNLLLGASAGGVLLALLGWLALRKKSPKEPPVVNVENIDETTAIKTIVGGDIEKPLYSDGEHHEMVDDFVEDVDTISDATMVVETQPEPFVEPLTTAEKSTVESGETSISVEDEADIVAAMTAELAAGDLDLGLDVDDDLSSAVGVDGIEDEVLSESNVYLAYGLHDQAIELLKPAVESNPDRTDYASKLLEAYHATGNKEAFIRVASGLQDKIGADDSLMWQRAIVMGKDLVPDNALFVNADSGDLTLTAIQSQRAELMDVGENDEPLTEIEMDSKTLPVRREGGEFDVESNLAGEFELPDLDELSQSLQMDGDEVTIALKESQDELSQEILADLTGQLEGFKPDLGNAMDLDEDANLTLADVESELTSLTTGADEMSTKLDLAKAYIDMGDDEGAREALEEVISQGDEAQSGEARKLMDQIV